MYEFIWKCSICGARETLIGSVDDIEHGVVLIMREIEHALSDRCNGTLEVVSVTTARPVKQVRPRDHGLFVMRGWASDPGLIFPLMMIVAGAAGMAMLIWSNSSFPSRDEFNGLRDAVYRQSVDCVTIETRLRDAQDDVAAMRRALHDLEVRHVRR